MAAIKAWQCKQCNGRSDWTRKQCGHCGQMRPATAIFQSIDDTQLAFPEHLKASHPPQKEEQGLTFRQEDYLANISYTATLFRWFYIWLPQAALAFSIVVIALGGRR